MAKLWPIRLGPLMAALRGLRAGRLRARRRRPHRAIHRALARGKSGRRP